MNLEKFKKLSKKFRNTKNIVWNDPEYEEYVNAFHNDIKCCEWELKRILKKERIDYKKFCCIEMAYHLIEDRKDRGKKINYDSVITFRSRTKDYGLPIHDGGTSYIKINYCPWCGKKLNNTKI